MPKRHRLPLRALAWALVRSDYLSLAVSTNLRSLTACEGADFMGTRLSAPLPRLRFAMECACSPDARPLASNRVLPRPPGALVRRHGAAARILGCGQRG